MLQSDVRRLDNGYVIDNGPLLVHMVGAWRAGRYLSQVQANLPEIRRVARTLEELVTRTRRIVITPQVVTEFQAVAQTRMGLDRRTSTDFLIFCREFLSRLDEQFMPLSSLIGLKDVMGLWRLSFTDSSLIMASQYTGLPLLTMDEELRSRSQELGVEVYHLYYDFYLRTA